MTPKTRMTHQRLILILILFFHSVNTYMDRACIASAIDFIKLDLQITDQMIGYILGIFAIGYALFQVPAGWVADRFGPRAGLTSVVTLWSMFTMLTGAARNAIHMLILRFMFGVGEAGAFPGATRAFYKWLPVKERGMAHGINFSGSRLGAALSLFLMPWLVQPHVLGWRLTFVANGLVGVVWAMVWLIWFRDNPKDNKKINAAELDYIETGRTSEFVVEEKVSFAEIFTSLNMSMAMLQYFASNVTFFISLTWLPKYLKDQWGPEAIYYSAIPLLFAAAANWVAGSLVTWLYNKGFHISSRRIPAIIGFGLGVIGLVIATQVTSLYWFVFCFSLATLGVDMTLSPSWAFCNDIGGNRSGSVSGSMNMVGNIGAALSAILFPFFRDYVTIPGLPKVEGSANSFFLLAALLNLVAIGAWIIMNPNRSSKKNLPEKTMKRRFMATITFLVLLTLGAVGTNIYLNNRNKAERPVPACEQRVETEADSLSQPDSLKLE